MSLILTVLFISDSLERNLKKHQIKSCFRIIDKHPLLENTV